ncbi:MAG: hemolysin III family protein [Pyrinomonadaceae bacterium]
MEDRLSFYHPTEELFNVISHGAGLLLSLIGFATLLFYGFRSGSWTHVVALGIYGLSLVVLYAASTSYHYVQEPKLRYKLNIFDHAAIYCLIAGSYTPYALLFFAPRFGWTMMIVVWLAAGAGVVFKLFFTGKYNAVGTGTYILMGWMGVFAIGPLSRGLPIMGVSLLIASGCLYTIGAILYGLHRVKFNHAIFHVFVLLGSIAHFVSVFYFLLPSSLGNA